MERSTGIPRKFTFNYILEVGSLAGLIGDLYPGHAVDKNIPQTNPLTGKTLTDFDIVLKNAVIEVKGGENASGILTQIAKQQGLTDLPVIGYGPKLPNGVIKEGLR